MTGSGLPSAVAGRIETLAACADEQALTRDARALSRTYRSGSGSAKGAGDALAYAVSRMPATFAAAGRALSLTLACTDARPDTLLDAGAGTGALTLAASSLLSLRRRVCLERESAMRALGEELTQAAGSEADWRPFDFLTEKSPLPRAGLVTEGYKIGRAHV